MKFVNKYSELNSWFKYSREHFLDSYLCKFELNILGIEAINSGLGKNVSFLVALEKGIRIHLPLKLMNSC